MKRILAMVIALSLLVIPAWSALAEEAEQPDDMRIFGEFAVSDLSGGEQTQAIFENAPLTLVNFWGTFCPPCIQEMPDLAALSEEYAGRVQILGVISDAYIYPDGVSQEILDDAMAICEQTGAGVYTHLIPDVNMAYRVLSALQAYPTTAFIDAQGHLIGQVVFGARDKQDWIEIIEETLELLPDDAFAAPAADGSDAVEAEVEAEAEAEGEVEAEAEGEVEAEAEDAAMVTDAADSPSGEATGGADAASAEAGGAGGDVDADAAGNATPAAVEG